MKFLRNKRRLVGFGALGALVALTMWVVFPAAASNPGDYVAPASGAGVLPYDVPVGGTGDCANLFTGDKSLGAGVSEYDNVNPKTRKNLASGHNDGVSFDLTVNAPNNQSQTLDIVGHGPVAILGIGIKGGTQSTAYNYKLSTAAGYVTSDTGLHAPLQSFDTTTDGTTTTENGTQFYSLSQLSVCYVVLKYIQGTVYQDTNQNGTNDDNSPRVGWTVSLYSGVTAGTAGGGTLVSSQPTTATGSYHFDVPANSSTTYRVCEKPASGDSPSNGAPTWVQVPLASTALVCNGAGELQRGYDVPSAQLSKTADFANVGGYSCNNAPVGVTSYTVGTCKANQLYVFNSGTTNGAPFVDYWVGDPSQAQIPVVEVINFDDPFVSGQPKYTKLLYADGGGFPPSFNNLPTMPYCQVDPRNPYGSDGFALQAQYQTVGANNSGAVLGNATSCVISIKTIAPVTPTGNGTLQAYVYALGDSVRVGN